MMWKRIVLLSIITVSSAAAMFPDRRIGPGRRTMLSADLEEQQLQLHPTSPSYPHYTPHATTMQPSPEVPAVPTLTPKTNPTFAPVKVEAPVAVSPAYYYAAKEREDFEDYCVAYLIARYFTWDGLISQNDFAFFLTEYCVKESKMCEKDEELEFAMLPTPIQLVFVNPLCAGVSLCLIESQPEFGYAYNDETKEAVEIQMTELCASLYPLIVGEYAAPAVAPISSYHPPTAPVTISPHSTPTDAPDAPIFQPHYTPVQVMPSPLTPAPILLKTVMPANETPVFAPTEPTDSPIAPIVTTRQPTDSPTTEAPVFTPSEPTDSPVRPVFTPTQETNPPTMEVPVFMPSESMDTPVGPAFTPTLETDSPVAPSVSPTFSPETLAPTTSSVATMLPVSLSPIISPATTPPSASPSLVSSSSPSLVPSGSLSLVLSGSPTVVPSGLPSATPAVVFINEIGVSSGNEFVEVSYSSFVGSGIEFYSIHGYDAAGMILGSGNLAEGSIESNGVTFTVVTVSNTTGSAEGFALVDDLLGDVPFFLSSGIIITAVDGPAKGLTSTDISMPQSNAMPPDNSRFFQFPENQNDSSLSLVGVGCDFDAFVFSERPSTPGAVNIDQQIEGCRSPPSAAPIQIGGGGDGISTGAIVGIAASSAVLVVVLLYLLSGRIRGGAQDTEERTISFDAQPANEEIGPGEEFMADTGSSLFGEDSDMASLQGINKEVGSGEVESNSSGAWWNSVFWMGAGGSNVTGKGSIAGSVVSSGAEPDAVALAAGATGAAIGTRNKRRKWFGRNANAKDDADELSEGTKTPEGTDGGTGASPGDPRDEVVVQPKKKRKAKSKRLSAAAAKASFAAGDAATIALARKDEDEIVDSKAIPAADANSEALENLDAALDKHDWDAIYSIADTIRTDSPRSGSGGRQPLGFAAASRGVSRAASAALPSDSESDAGRSAHGGSETTGSVGGILGVARRKDPSPASVSELSSKSGDRIIGASPRKGESSDSEAVGNVSKIPEKVGWTSLFRRKGRKGRKSQGDSVSLSAAAEDEPNETGGGANVLQASMQALQQEFPDAPTSAVDIQSSSIGTGYVSPLDEWGSHASSHGNQGANIQEAEQDAAKLDMGAKSAELADKKTLLVDSIQQISNDLESSAQVANDDPSLAGPGMEEEIERLIAAKDWRALAEFANREEVFIESERHTIEARGEIFTSDAERLARQNVRKEFEEAILPLRTTERPDGTSFETNKDFVDDASSVSD